MERDLSVDNNEVDPLSEETSSGLARKDLSDMTTEELLELKDEIDKRILTRDLGEAPLAHHDFGGRGSFTSL